MMDGQDMVKFQSTLLMRGATASESGRAVPVPISIHAPHARSDTLREYRKAYTSLFQSTLLMRGATGRCQRLSTDIIFQSTLLMRGATRFSMAESVEIEFQSTLLMRGATTQVFPTFRAVHNFNPRSSCEERQEALAEKLALMKFQSTLLMRGAT